MSTATDIVNGALKLLNLKSALLGYDPYHQAEGFTALKDLLYYLEGEEVELDLDIPDETSDELDEVEWMTRCLKYLTAVEVAPLLRAKVPSRVAVVADKAMETLLIKGVPDANPKRPNNLPLGQGNRRGPKGQVYFNEE